jgi:hypothetical protein
MMFRQPRFPTDELIAWWEQRYGQEFNVTRFAQQAGIDRSMFHHWQQRGGIPLWSADRVAIRCGVHPCRIWPDWFRGAA